MSGLLEDVTVLNPDRRLLGVAIESRPVIPGRKVPLVGVPSPIGKSNDTRLRPLPAKSLHPITLPESPTGLELNRDKRLRTQGSPARRVAGLRPTDRICVSWPHRCRYCREKRAPRVSWDLCQLAGMVLWRLCPAAKGGPSSFRNAQAARH